MGFRNVCITSPATLKISQCNLLIDIPGNTTQYVHIEDIDTLLIENTQSTISSAALIALAQNGALVLFCDQQHIPSTISLPYNQHCQSSYIARTQMSKMNKVKKGNIWKDIVSAKINNQAKCLAYHGFDTAAVKLYQLSKSVVSGDHTNREAAAAGIYFRTIFGENFSRDQECDVNSYLNYGYAVLRAMVTRSIAIHGLLPMVGVFHKSDAFSLADDLMEPFRPCVDLLSIHYLQQGWTFDISTKHALARLGQYEVLTDGRKSTISVAVDTFVCAFRQALESDVAGSLKTPTLIDFRGSIGE